MKEVVKRPWGTYQTIYESDMVHIKQIVVWPDSRLSYQFHRKRNEHWYIISGKGMAIISDCHRKISPGDSLNIKKMTPHRIANYSEDNLVFIEIQTGEYFGEDDIVRLEDDYNRTT